MATCTRVARNPKIGDQINVTLNPQTYETDLELTDTYKVQFSDSTATPIDAAVATDGTNAIPQIGTKYGTSGTAAQLICLHINPVRRRETPTIFDVQVTWRNIVLQGTGARWNINIAVRPIRYEQDAWVDKTVTGGGTGVPIVNSANQTFNPTLKKIFYDEEIDVSFDCGATEAGNVITATGDGVTSGCKGHYNPGPITLTVNGVARTFPAGTLLYGAPEYSTVYVGSPPYDWKFALNFQYRRDGWKDQVPDRGYFSVIDNGAGWAAAGYAARYTKQTFKDMFGDPVSEPILMNGSGAALPDVAPGTVTTPTLLTFDNYGPGTTGDWTSLLSGIM